MLRFVQRDKTPNDWKRPAGMDEVIYELLASRGVRSDEDAVAFLNPEVLSLPDPMNFIGMEAAVSRILRAKAAGEAVCVFGDYDVDGVCATVILLCTLRALSIDVMHYIPTRAEGYGLNEAAVRKIAKDASLLITVDCGITSVKEVALAKELSLDVIVSDHHQMRGDLPDAILLHPMLGREMYPHFCGAGVSWMLASALDPDIARGHLDLAALATVADVVPLTSVNRAIVKLGIVQMNERPRPGISALIRASGLTGALTAENIAFQLAPRINASGRLVSAEKSLFLLLSESEEEAAPLAQALNEHNDERRQVEAGILRSIQEKLKEYDLAHSGAIVLTGEDWNPGVVGLAASRLVESHNLPTILLARDKEGVFVGSCRSIPGVDIMEALLTAAPLMEKYGGHPQAAGLTIREENVAPFREAVNRHILETAPSDAFVKRMTYDLQLPLKKLTPKLVSRLKALEPFGHMNPEPVFLSDGRVSSARAVGKDGAHLQLRLSGDGMSTKAVWFRRGDRANGLIDKEVTALYCARLNTFQGATNVDLLVGAMEEISPLDGDRMEKEFPLRAYECLLRFSRGEPFENGERLKPFRAEDARKAIEGSPRGTLFYARSLVAARRFAKELEAAGLSERLDIYPFAWPEDPIGMNALSIMAPGPPPPRYDRVYFVPGEAREFSPTIDELRKVFLALRALLAKPYHFSNFHAFTDDLVNGAEISMEKCVAGLVILSEMALIEVNLDALSVKIIKSEKKNPEDSLAFQRLQALQ